MSSVDNKYKLKKLFSETDIKNRVSKLAIDISESYSSKEDLIVVCVLNGSILFCSDLIKQMNENVILDTFRVKSYNKKDRCDIEVVSDLKVDVKGKKVLIVEDIVDTGQTINFIYDYIISKKPDDIRTVSFLFKPDVYKLNINIDWVGFEIPNYFVVGYGLDYDERYRNLDSIYRLVNEEK